MPDLTTLQRVKRTIKTSSDDSSDDLMILQFISDASKMVHEFCQRSFVPSWGTLLFDAHGDHIRSRSLDLDTPAGGTLLELTSIANGDGNTIAVTDVVLYPLNRTPKTKIQLKNSCNTPFTYADDWHGAIQIAGAWGYHDDYDSAWVDTLDTVQDAPLAASAATITVVNADGSDSTGNLRFEVLQYLRMEDEIVQVVGINADTNTLTVRRAALGTTAAEHAVTTAITSYRPMDDIRLACTSLATWLYKTRQSTGEKIQFLDGTTIITNEAPANIKLTLDKHTVLRIGS